MDVSKLGPFPEDREPEVDPAYFEKIREEMKVVEEKIAVVRAQPNTEEIWCTLGDIKYGHPLAPLILRLRALIWFFKNPPDPRGEKMYSRVGPYTVFVRREDLLDIFPYELSMSTIDRMLAEVREKFDIKPYGRITVELFCYAHGLPEDKIQKKLDDLFKKRWKKHKGNDE